MMRKLLKHEFIASGRIMGPLYAVVVLLTGYLTISYYVGEPSMNEIWKIVLVPFIALVVFMFTVIVTINSFQKSLYSDQGYLSFTLPVKSTSLLFSKVFVSTIWYILAVFCLLGSLYLTAYESGEVAGEEAVALLDTFLMLLFGGKTIGTIIASAIVKLLFLFMSLLLVTNTIFLAISVANTRHFQKRHVLWTIVFAVGFDVVIMNISELVSANITFGLAVTEEKFSLITSYSDLAMNAVFTDAVQPIFSLIVSIGLFFATRYVMHKKVNIR